MKQIATLLLILTIALLVVGILQVSDDKIYEEKLREQLEEVTVQRDLLSDILRNTYDITGDTTIPSITNYYLSEINCNFDSISNWSYCY